MTPYLGVFTQSLEEDSINTLSLRHPVFRRHPRLVTGPVWSVTLTLDHTT